MDAKTFALDLTVTALERISPPNQDYDFKQVANAVADVFDQNYHRALEDFELEEAEWTVPEKAIAASRLAIAGLKFIRGATLADNLTAMLEAESNNIRGLYNAIIRLL